MKTDQFIFHLLHQAHQAASQAFESEITPTQYVILNALYELGDGVNQRALIRATGIDRSTTTDVLRRMELIGLVTRIRRADDLRSVSVSMTKEGRHTYHNGTRAAEKANESLLARIPESRRKAFIRDLEGIGRVAVEAVKEAA